jgi:hypothetical protein
LIGDPGILVASRPIKPGETFAMRRTGRRRPRQMAKRGATKPRGAQRRRA